MSILEDQPQLLEYEQALTVNQAAIILLISTETLNVQQQ
jgi:hypothetical protein